MKNPRPSGLLALIFFLFALSGCNAPLGPAQGAATGDPNVGGGRAVVVGQMPTPAGTAIPVKQSLSPGSVVSTGSLTFTLDSVETQNGQTVVTYQLQGLPRNFSEAVTTGSPWIVLTDGEILPALEGEGGGSPVGAARQVQFTALPPSARSFTLVIPNTWTGSLQTWYIPIKMP